MSGSFRKPFLRWPSQRACADEIGAGRHVLSNWVLGRRSPRPCPALDALLAAGWAPPPRREPGRGPGRGPGRKPARPLEAPGLKPPLPPEKVLPPSQDVLRRARERPEGCSEARWRMELARRRRGYAVRLDPDDI